MRLAFLVLASAAVAYASMTWGQTNMTVLSGRDFPVKPYDAATAEKYPLGKSTVEEQVAAILASGKDVPFKPTGATRDIYLDLAEVIVRAAAKWQNAEGASIDPVENKEFNQASPRFVASAAVLLHFGRIQDLKEVVYTGMDYGCAKLASGTAQSPDFWMRELMTAYLCMNNAPAERRAKWAANIRSVVPEKIYWNVEKPDQPIKDLHNWTIYAAGGEGLRQLAGLAPAKDSSDVIWGAKFFEKYMPWQLSHFSADGMYRDPNDPLTYDMTTRLQIATPLAYGFESPLSGIYQELLRRGGLSQLLYVSPLGQAPFGGRSGQMQLQEAILSALGELEARRYRNSNPALAMAFKRQAHLSALSLKPWIQDMQPHRHVKNGFGPDKRFGIDGYAGYSVYSLFASSCLGLAALYADENIPEGITPVEIGGYVTEFKPAFHKIFANAGGVHIEIDTAADLHYDATGLGRLHRIGMRPELGLSMPFAANDHYTKMPKELTPPTEMAIGPSWQEADGKWVSLASLSDGLQTRVVKEQAAREKVAFSLNWTHADRGVSVVEHYLLEGGRLKYRVVVELHGKPASKIRLTVPLLETDGDAKSSQTISVGRASVAYRGNWYEVIFDPSITPQFEKSVANRNGIYKPMLLEVSGNEIHMEMELK